MDSSTIVNIAGKAFIIGYAVWLLFNGKYSSSGEYILARDLSDITEAWDEAREYRKELIFKWKHVRSGKGWLERAIIDLKLVAGIAMINIAGAIDSTLTCFNSAKILGALIWAVSSLMTTLVDLI